MFENIGKKIKSLTKFVCWVGIIASIVAAIGMMCSGDDVLIIIGVILLFVGPIMAWIGSFVMYGFGELVDRTTSIETYLRSDESNLSAPKKAEPKKADPLKISEMERLRSQGLITEEEYQQAISN